MLSRNSAKEMSEAAKIRIIAATIKKIEEMQDDDPLKEAILRVSNSIKKNCEAGYTDCTIHESFISEYEKIRDNVYNIFIDLCFSIEFSYSSNSENETWTLSWE